MWVWTWVYLPYIRSPLRYELRIFCAEDESFSRILKEFNDFFKEKQQIMVNLKNKQTVYLNSVGAVSNRTGAECLINSKVYQSHYSGGPANLERQI